SAVVVATVDIVEVSGLSYQVSVSKGGRLLLRPDTWQLRPGYLAGPLGFEPRQSAPKALDLPLVDGPVKRSDWLIAVQLSFNNCRLTTVFYPATIESIQNSSPILLARQRTGRHRLQALLPQTAGRLCGVGWRPEQPVQGRP